MRNRTRTLALRTAFVLVALAASPARAGTITKQGNVQIITSRAQLTSGFQGNFDEGPLSGSVPLGVYSSSGLTWRTGSFASILPGVTTPGTATQGGYWNPNTYFPSPIGGAGTQTGAATYLTGVATFSTPITIVGLTASTNGTQYLTAWNTTGQMIGQVTWVPSGDAAFIGLDSMGVAIGMVAFGNDDLWNGQTYEVGGSTNISDSWIWLSCDRDGIHDAGEQCDDGNATNGDGCSATCKLEYCGNLVLDPGELCDDGNKLSGDGCSSDCKSKETCGNGIVDVAKGEKCDDGNTQNGDACNANCALPSCGDGVLNVGETCDDGNKLSGDGCNATCTSKETCGNGIVDTAKGESCDDANTTSGDGCSSVCDVEFCGNGLLDPGETCDDGNTMDGDGCASDCQSDETCGNGTPDVAAGEQCDDGGSASGDGCSDTCQFEFCGNGNVDVGEVCDDGGTNSADGCASDCKSDETCGNGIVDPEVGELCDDGNDVDGDGCQASCTLTSCGDGVLDPGETCDDGNVASGDGCSATCASDEACGNGVVDLATGEQCDDSNATSGDGCSAACAFEVCGNGTIDANEVCDDGNRTDGDGCSSLCLSDETCGNDFVDSALGELCDDGNATPGDGCSATCGPETCGNGILEEGEVCDDGNREGGDGCSVACVSDETCGNGFVDVERGEQCDLGEANGGELCNADCTINADGANVLLQGGCTVGSAGARSMQGGATLLLAGALAGLVRRLRRSSRAGRSHRG